MKGRSSKTAIFLSMVPLLSACFHFNNGGGTRYEIAYSEEGIDQASFEKYLLAHSEEYPSYPELKKNSPDVLSRAKKLDLGESNGLEVDIYRFSYAPENGFLEGESFLYWDNTYYQLGDAWGGNGLTEYFTRAGDSGSWLYFVYSSGSGVHRTNIGVFDLLNEPLFYTIEGLELDVMKDYTLLLDKETRNLGLYEATIQMSMDEEKYPTYQIERGELVNEAIDRLKRVAVK